MNQPLIQALDGHGLSPMELFARIPATAKKLVFLASDGSADSRWSILAWDPVEGISDQQKIYHGNLPFIGGKIGTIDYEGQAEFYYYDQALIYDHHEKCWWGVGSVVIPTEEVLLRAEESLTLTPSWSFPEYQQAFNIIHDNIRRGEIYQACLTFPFTGSAVANPRNLFASLLQKNPAPMAAYLEQNNRTVISLSPERFISWDGKTLETKPIKGTRKHGENEQEDERLKQELLADEKEEAELTMITDLLRNDLAKVSKPGTVKVLQERSLQSTPNVWHTYSHIVSETKEGISAWNIIESMFPGGSISGCPKQRAMEILKKVEDQPRGIYTGCIGYISDHGRMDLNIAIRTLEQRGQTLKAGFGSGIVYDSTAEKEYDECLAKATLFTNV